MEYLKKLFGGKEDSIESIVSDFTAKVNRLRSLANKHLSDADDKRTEAKLLSNQAEDHEKQHDKALKIASKIDNLLSD